MNATRVMKELQVKGRRKGNPDYLKSLWTKQVYSKGWNPSLQEYNMILGHISTGKGRKWFEWGDQVFNACAIRHKADQTTFKSYFEILIKSNCRRKGELIEQVIKDHDVEMTPKLLICVIKGYLFDKNYHRAIEMLEDYYYKKGFLNHEFYEELILLLARSEKGSHYALKELYYKILKGAPEINITEKMQQGFLECCKRIKSMELMYLLSSDKNEQE